VSRTNREIFGRANFDIPKRRSSASISTFTKGTFSNFLKDIRSFHGAIAEKLKPNLELISAQCDSISSALDLYLKGGTAVAYQVLKKCLDELNEIQVLPIQQVPKEGNESLYRVRTSINNQLRKEDLFHIPFELREKVSTQRYSIPGLPCLYLADSIFVCWEEMGRPDISQMYVSRFDLSSSHFKFLFFTVNTDTIRRRCFTSDARGKFVNQFVSFLTYWPILSACSTIVEKPSDTFKPEYIIPQLVLQWVVSERKLDGVQYRSNRIKVDSHSTGSFNNIVVPVLDANDTGFCSQLKNKVKLTNPISWQLLDISNSLQNIARKDDYEIKDLRRAMFVELIGGEKTIYVDSKFGLMEEKLKGMKATHIA